MTSRTLLLVLLVANVLVLLGQAWPEGAPPFARTFNLATAAANILLLGFMLGRKSRRG